VLLDLFFSRKGVLFLLYLSFFVQQFHPPFSTYLHTIFLQSQLVKNVSLHGTYNLCVRTHFIYIPSEAFQYTRKSAYQFLYIFIKRCYEPFPLVFFLSARKYVFVRPHFCRHFSCTRLRILFTLFSFYYWKFSRITLSISLSQ